MIPLCARVVRVCLLIFLVCCPPNIIGLWWADGNPLVMTANSICRRSRRLGGKQREMCRNEPEIIRLVSSGASLAITECQQQFRNRRWNCDVAKRAISKVLRLNTREAGFVNAMTSAGVVYSVTSACSDGSMLQCSCDSSMRQDVHVRPSPNITDGKWEWSGCNDNVNFGYTKSREFLDVKRRKKKKSSDMTNQITLHNNEAGRRSVMGYMRMVCKCHGLSGSCTLKTCWRKMPTLRTISTVLKSRFDGAVKVTISNDGKHLLPIGEESIKPPMSADLVYSMPSPDYCEPNKSLGSLGTARRECDPDSQGVGGCDLLCCGRGYSSEKVQVTENCHCRFRWCCEVICQTCRVTKYIHRCKKYK